MKRATGRYNSTVDICAISIHALVKRATLVDGQTYNDVNISIHALVKRATSPFI